jgi:DNA-binding CsgD family transcriptional regulator
MVSSEHRLLEWTDKADGAQSSPWQTHVKELVAQVLREVPASHWTLGIFDSHENLIEFYLSDSTFDLRAALDLVFTPPLPELSNATSITVTQDSVENTPFPWRLSALVVTSAKCAAKLVLLREMTEQGFSLVASHIIRTPLNALSRALALRTYNPDDEADLSHARRFPQPALYLLDDTYSIEFMWKPKDIGSIALAQLAEPVSGHLPAFIETVVRRLTNEWDLGNVETCVSGVSRPIPGLLLRTIPMMGVNGVTIGVLLEPYRTRRSLRTAAAKFHISRRERDVLLLLFDGYSIGEIAARLHLAESTVQDHVKRMIFKTDSHNRIEMAAKLLGWPLVRTAEA